MAKVCGVRTRFTGAMALRAATLRISVGSTSGWREVSLSKALRGSRHTSLSRRAATLRVRWPCDSSDISPTMLPGGISAISSGSSALFSSSWRNTPRQPAATTKIASAGSPWRNSGAPPGRTSSVSSFSMAARLWASRSANNGARCSAFSRRSRAGFSRASTRLISPAGP